MSLLSGISDFFGLDIGTSAMRLVQLKGVGRVKALQRYSAMPIDAKLVSSDANADRQKLAGILAKFIAESGVSAKNVAVGLPSSKVFSTVVDFDKLSPEELAKTIQLQADSLIPTPLSESKIDWAMIGDSPANSNKVEVLLSSVANSFIEKKLDLLESIGLNVIAFEPDSMAVCRATIPAENHEPTMVIDVGSVSADLVISIDGIPHLTRAISTGTASIIQAAVQNLGIEKQQAEQFIFKFGLSKDKLEGQIYNAIISTVELLVSEIEKSIKYFNTRYPNKKINGIIVTGGASSLPEFPLYIANKFGIPVEIGNAWRNVAYPVEKQNELLAVSNQFSVAAGLAERIEQ